MNNSQAAIAPVTIIAMSAVIDQRVTALPRLVAGSNVVTTRSANDHVKIPDRSQRFVIILEQLDLETPVMLVVPLGVHLR